MADEPNVLLVVLDSVRARNVGFHGSDRETTPFLSEFVEEATMLSQARSPDIHSISSHVGLFTGYHTEEHGITDHESYIDPAATIWADLAGHATGLFTPNVIVTEASNLDAPFERVVGPKRTTPFEGALSPGDIDASLDHATYLRRALADDRPLRSVANGLYAAYADTGDHDPTAERASVYTDALLEWIDGVAGPWAACLNLMDAHSPYVPDPEYDRWADDAFHDIQAELSDPRTVLTEAPLGSLRALEYLYDGCIHQLDASLGELVAGLKRRGEYEDTLLVITSDHGEGFGERSRIDPRVRLIGHRWGIGEELTHVPLLVKEPGGDGGRRIDEAVSLTRFPAAVRAALAGEPAADAFRPPDGIVRSSTERIVPPGDELPFPAADREKLFGPWIARYRTEAGKVLKYATRGDDDVSLSIPDAHTSDRLERPDEVLREAASEEFEPAGIERGDTNDREVGEEVERRLDDLGYLR